MTTAHFAPPDFVPRNFVPPRLFVTQSFRLEVLHPRHNLLDYDAVMSSEASLHSVFADHHDWPSPRMTLAENGNDLREHYAEFELRQGFTYTILTLAASRCIGCLYIYPPRIEPFDAEVFFWLRSGAEVSDQAVWVTLGHWLKHAWPFSKVVWPGREIPWSDWRSGPRREVGKELPDSVLTSG
ncbi:MAG: hypothetical protein AAF458_01320 [Pseudomonadota bacterium]